MSDAFLLGAGFSKAVSNVMPTMHELYMSLEDLIGRADGFTYDAYEYTAGDAEALLSYYAIASPQDDMVGVIRKRRVTELIEIGIGAFISSRESEGASVGFNPQGSRLVSKWHDDRSQVLTTNYDSIVERLSGDVEYVVGNHSYK